MKCVYVLRKLYWHAVTYGRAAKAACTVGLLFGSRLASLA